MKLTRRGFLAGTASLAALAAPRAARAVPSSLPEVGDEALERARTQPVLDARRFKDPIIIEVAELLKRGKDYFVRVRSRDGAVGIAVDNGRGPLIRTLLNQQVLPYFQGVDARDLEEHLFGVYRYKDNYKLQGLLMWSAVALVEFAILDLLGRIAGTSIGGLFAAKPLDRVMMYAASVRRDTTPEQEIVWLQKLLDDSGARSIKYRVGGRMSRNADAMPGRTEKLIALSRKTFGDRMGIMADSNSSYDPPEAIRVGRLLEDIGALFFEEPCPFDNLDANRKVAEALKIPVALGEQEFSEWRFQYTIRHRCADIIQPDLYYYGGFIRSLRVARMAALRGMPTTPHDSDGFGFVYNVHFASCIPNPGAAQEYKAGVKPYGDWFNPPLRFKDGVLPVPQGPGVGLGDPDEILKGAGVLGG